MIIEHTLDLIRANVLESRGTAPGGKTVPSGLRKLIFPKRPLRACFDFALAKYFSGSLIYSLSSQSFMIKGASLLSISKALDVFLVLAMLQRRHKHMPPQQTHREMSLIRLTSWCRYRHKHYLRHAPFPESPCSPAKVLGNAWLMLKAGESSLPSSRPALSCVSELQRGVDQGQEHRYTQVLLSRIRALPSSHHWLYHIIALLTCIQ